MRRPFDFEPELAAFATPEESASVDSGLPSNELLAELRRRLDAWRAQLPKPSREQMLTGTHKSNRDQVLFHDDTPHLWEGLEREWRERQKPDFQPLRGEDLSPDEGWPPEAREWLEKERRAGRIYQEESEAEAHYRYSRPFEAPQRESRVVFMSTLESTPGKSQPSPTDADREPTDAQLLEFMRPSARHEFEKPGASPKDRARIWQGTKKRWMAAHRPPKKIANEDIVRDTGHTDRQVRESLERRYMPLSSVQSSPFTQPSTPSVIWSFLRKFAAVGGVFLLGACWTMIQIDEYALAIVLLLVGMTAFALQVYDWKGIEDSSTATRILKIVAGVLIAACLLFFLAVIIKKKGNKAWSILLPTTAASPDRASASSTPTPTTTPLVLLKPSPLPTATLTPQVNPDYFSGGVSIVGGASRRLDQVLRIAGYKGPLVLETLEFYNHSEVDVCWRVGAAAERCLNPGDGYNFPGGVDASQVYVSAKADAKLDIGLKSK